MPPEDTLAALRRRPFEPFRIHRSDGTTYEIRHPELAMLGLRSLHVGIPARGLDQPMYERVHVVALSHIVRLEPLPADSATEKE